MISYNSSSVVQVLRQYDMFANSLNLVKVRDERNMIINQLTKLEKKIIELTNEIYEKEYYALANKETCLLEDERERLTLLIDLISQRLSYVEKRNNNHYQLTGEVVDVSEVLGVNTLDTLEERMNIIDKYEKNNKLAENLKLDIETLNNKIDLIKEKLDINESLNIELEKKMKSLLSDSFDRLGLYKLLENKNEIEYAYRETEKNLMLAKQNLEVAKTSPANILEDCQAMVLEVEKDYVKYKEKICLLKLMEIFKRDVNDYDELLIKRKEMNELLKNVKDKDINDLIYGTLTKQYETIMMEIEDSDKYHDLVKERDQKHDTLIEIDEENNSERFQSVLGELLENERRKQEKIAEEQRLLEEKEKQKRLEVERKKQEEILKKQKIIEEARKKEIEKRTRELLVQQKNSVLQTKNKESRFSFETMKDLSNKKSVDEPKIEIEEQEEVKDNSLNFELNLGEELPEEKEVIELQQDKVDDFPIFKNKIDIEKELFEEFNNKDIDVKEDVVKEREILDDNKLPNISLDEYMNKFNEYDLQDDDIQDLFKEDDIFPNIPL